MRFVYFVKYKFEFLFPIGTEDLRTDLSFITSFFKFSDLYSVSY